MQPHAGRGLGVGERRSPVQEEDQFGALPQLVSGGPSPHDRPSPIEELRRQVGTVRGQKAGHGADPTAAIAASI